MLYCSVKTTGDDWGQVPSKDSSSKQFSAGSRKRRVTWNFFCFFLLAVMNAMWPQKLLSSPGFISSQSSRQSRTSFVRCLGRDFVSSLSRSLSTRPLLPIANAFVSQSNTIATRREAETRTEFYDAKQERIFGLYSAQTHLSAVVVPELDDTFPEDFDSSSNNNNNNNNNNDNGPQGNIPPLGSDDYFAGVEDFQLDDIPTSLPDDGYSVPKENIVSPFPFPGPEVGGSDSSASSIDSNFERSPFSVPTTPTTDLQNSDLDDAIQKLKNMNDSITKLTNENANSRSDNGVQFGSTSNISDLNSNKQTGRRTMATLANENENESDVGDDSGENEEYDLWQPLDLESTTTTEQPQDTAFAQFSSIMDDTGPVKPLVAPLKLSKPSKTTVQSTDPSDSSAVPSIEANGLDDLVDSLQGQLKNIQREIEVMAGDKAESINLNSPKQISELLFGRPDMSTNKSTLEGMAASNILAKLILEYRETKRKLNKTLKQQEVRNVSSGETSSDSDSSSIAPPKPMVDPVMLLDTSSFIFRAYYSNPPIHRARDGMPTGAVMGFCSMLNKLLLSSMLRGETPILVHCLDAPGKSFRNDLYPDYKAHRPPIPLDLVPQFNLIKNAIKAYGMIQIQAPGFEADDVIATLATVGSQTEGLDVRILSGDKDLMQLVTEDDDDDEIETGMVHMVDPMTSKIWNHEMVMEKWGVKASQLGDVLALAGDAADNVPGVPGIGPKIAAQLLQEFGSLESLLDNTDEIPQPKRREKLETNIDSARISRELVDLQRGLEWSQMEAFLPPPTDGGNDEGIPTPMLDSTKISELRMQPIQVDRILAFYDDMGFHKLKTQLLDRVGKAQPSGQTSSGTPQASTATVPRKASKGPVVAAKPAAKQAATTKPKARPKRTYWEKTKRTVPKPEDFKDVPF